MKLAPLLALAVLTAFATAPVGGPGSPGPKAEASPRPDRVAVSRAMSEIDDAERRGEIAAQRAQWSAAASAKPTDVVARFLSTYALPRTEDAWGRFRDLAKEFKTSSLGLVGQLRIYLGWKVYDQVDRLLPVALAVEPDDWLLTLVKGALAEHRERWADAEAAYQAVVALDPGNVEGHTGLARVKLHAGDQPGAQAEAELALAALPSHVPALAVLADLAAAKGSQVEAVALYVRIVAASPGDRGYRVALARLLRAKGDLAGARDQWKAALRLGEDADTLVALAEVSRQAGDTESEQRALERLSQLDPGGAEWKRIAEIRIAAKDLDGAEKALRRVLARDPKDQAGSLALGRVLVQAGRMQEAVEVLRASGDGGASVRVEVERRLNLERITRGDVSSLQRSVGALIDRTYRARLKELPRLSGRLVVRVTSDAAGRAALVEVLEDSVHDDDVRACAYWNLKDASYPQNRPGRYSFSFSLRPGR